MPRVCDVSSCGVQSGDLPWRCPACRTVIRHSEDELQPTQGCEYRCHVCRLELSLNIAANVLDIVPMDHEPQSEPTRARTLPNQLAKSKRKPKRESKS